MIRTLLALGVVISLAACGGGDDDLDDEMDVGIPAETQPMTADTMDMGVDTMMMDTMESDADSMMEDTMGGM